MTGVGCSTGDASTEVSCAWIGLGTSDTRVIDSEMVIGDIRRTAQTRAVPGASSRTEVAEISRVQLDLDVGPTLPGGKCGAVGGRNLDLPVA